MIRHGGNPLKYFSVQRYALFYLYLDLFMGLLQSLRSFAMTVLYFLFKTVTLKKLEISSDHSFLDLRRSEFEITDTLENAIANPAKTGFKSQPKIG